MTDIMQARDIVLVVDDSPEALGFLTTAMETGEPVHGELLLDGSRRHVRSRDVRK